MRILITGATGTVGTRLARAAFTAGHEISVIARDPKSAAGKLALPCRAFTLEQVAASPAEVFADVGAMVNLAGEPLAEGRWTAEKKQRMLDSRVETTRAIVAGIAKLPEGARPRALVSASAIGFYGDRGEEVLTELSAPGTGLLSEICRAWESEARPAEALGTRVAILRLGVVLSRGAGMLGELVPLFKKGLGGRVGSGAQWVSWIHLDDVVGAILHAIAQPIHGVFDLVAPEPVRQRDFAEALGGAVGLPAVMPAPAFALKLALGEKAEMVLASQRVAPRALPQSGFKYAYPKLADALADAVSPAGEEKFEAWQFVAKPIDEVFAFFSDANNLEKITPAWVGFRILEKSAGEMGEGTLIDYRIKLHGAPMRWRTRIEKWDPPRAFRDVQLKGPYQVWEHDHLFAPAANGTVMVDRVRYRVPFGALGSAVAGGFVGADVAKIFGYRQQALAGLL